MNTTGLFALTLLATSSALADPPAQPTEPPSADGPTQTKDVPKTPAAAAEPAVELEVRGKHLAYTYDLSSMFDEKLWKVLAEYGYSEITVEVKLRDESDQVRVTQYHQLKIELLDSGRIRVMTSPRRGRIYKNRAEMVTALRRVRGQPMVMLARDFAGQTGHLELVVLVNPVQVYDFPEDGAPVADRKVEPRTYYDRKLKLRSRDF